MGGWGKSARLDSGSVMVCKLFGWFVALSWGVVNHEWEIKMGDW